MMNRAVSGQFQPGVKENIAYFTLTERRNIAEGPGSRSNSPASSVPQTAAYEVYSWLLVVPDALEVSIIFEKLEVHLIISQQ